MLSGTIEQACLVLSQSRGWRGFLQKLRLQCPETILTPDQEVATAHARHRPMLEVIVKDLPIHRLEVWNTLAIVQRLRLRPGNSCFSTMRRMPSSEPAFTN